MAKLGPRSDRILFAPLIWRLALKIEQVPWCEVARSAAEAVYVLRSAQRLFKQDIHCVSFDTWLEAEAIGMQIERDQLGVPVGRPARIDDWPAVDSVLSADPIARTVEILRRLAQDPGGIVPLATLTAGATLEKRIAATASAASTDYVRQILLGLTRLYCEAGAGALLLLDEEPGGDDPAALVDYAALFNLAEYFSTPVFLLSREPMGPATAAAAQAAAIGYLAPGRVQEGIVALPADGGDVVADAGWMAMSTWEIDPGTDPKVVWAWRQKLLPN
jgi:hypothetical protein